MTRHSDYYVTVRDAGRSGFLLGPFPTRALAMDHVERDGMAWFYSYGTARVPHGSPVRAVFGGGRDR